MSLVSRLLSELDLEHSRHTSGESLRMFHAGKLRIISCQYISIVELELTDPGLISFRFMALSF